MTRVAAVDIGTNSVRLLVADGSGGTRDGGDARAAKVVPVERLMRITRLGQGVNEARALHPDAIERTLTVLREYREVIDRLGGVTSIRATATSAARDSSNRDEFFDAAEAALGARPELLSGEEEAALSFLGATATIDAPAPYLVVDIGGGSTEFVLGTDAPVGLVSLDMGCVRITEQFLHSDPPAAGGVVERDRDGARPRGRRAARDPRRARRRDARRPGRHRHHGRGRGAGPPRVRRRARSTASASTRAAVEDVFRTFATETAEQRASNPGLEPGRVDVIVGGTAVLAGLLRQLEFDEVLVSESDILDGLVRSQL